MLSVLVKFARCRLQFVSLGRFTATLRNELIDATLYCRSGQVLLIKKERHQAHQSLFGIQDEIFIPHNIKRVVPFFITMANYSIKPSLHLISLPLDKPNPPLGVVLGYVAIQLIAVADGVAE